jgi:hypothetical protein
MRAADLTKTIEKTHKSKSSEPHLDYPLRERLIIVGELKKRPWDIQHARHDSVAPKGASGETPLPVHSRCPIARRFVQTPTKEPLVENLRRGGFIAHTKNAR